VSSMAPGDIVRLVVLGAIWGGSFIFMRVLAPVIGPWATADARILVGGALLVLYAAIVGRRAQLARHWRSYLVIGVFNSGIPFTLLGFAALHLPGSYLGILNSAAPLFAAMLGVTWLGEALTPAKLAGLVLGCAGVALVSKTGPAQADALFGWAVAASLIAAFCYAAAGAYLRKRAAGAPATAMAGWSQLCAGALLLPATLMGTPASAITSLHDPVILGSAMALAIVCSALAYLLYFRLMRNIGPTRTLTVAFLIPLFAMLWGRMFLGEAITASMLVGCGLIIAGTLSVLRPAPSALAQVAS